MSWLETALNGVAVQLKSLKENKINKDDAFNIFQKKSDAFSGKWGDLRGAPKISKAGRTGNYVDLIDIPQRIMSLNYGMSAATSSSISSAKFKDIDSYSNFIFILTQFSVIQYPIYGGEKREVRLPDPPATCGPWNRFLFIENTVLIVPEYGDFVCQVNLQGDDVVVGDLINLPYSAHWVDCNSDDDCGILIAANTDKYLHISRGSYPSPYSIVEQTFPVVDNWSSIYYTHYNGVMVVASDSNRCLYSRYGGDSISWEVNYLPESADWCSVIEVNATFFVVAHSPIIDDNTDTYVARICNYSIWSNTWETLSNTPKGYDTVYRLAPGEDGFLLLRDHSTWICDTSKSTWVRVLRDAGFSDSLFAGTYIRNIYGNVSMYYAIPECSWIYGNYSCMCIAPNPQVQSINKWGETSYENSSTVWGSFVSFLRSAFPVRSELSKVATSGKYIDLQDRPEHLGLGSGWSLITKTSAANYPPITQSSALYSVINDKLRIYNSDGSMCWDSDDLVRWKCHTDARTDLFYPVGVVSGYLRGTLYEFMYKAQDYMYRQVDGSWKYAEFSTTIPSPMCVVAGKVIVVSKSTREYIYSSDCVTWQTGVIPCEESLCQMAYDTVSNRFVILSTSKCITSRDLINWEVVDLPMNQTWSSFAINSSNSIYQPFYMIATTQSNASNIIISKDGHTWTKLSIYNRLGFSTAAFLRSRAICVITDNLGNCCEFDMNSAEVKYIKYNIFNNDDSYRVVRFETVYMYQKYLDVLITNNGMYGYDNCIVCDDHVKTDAVLDSLKHVVPQFSNVPAVALSGEYDDLKHVPSSISWDVSVVPSDIAHYEWEDIMAGESVYVVINEDLTKSATSYDGIHWQTHDMNTIFSGSSDYTHVCCCSDDTFLIFLRTQSKYLMSKDGIHWDIIDCRTELTTIRQLIYADGAFVGVTNLGVCISEDGLTWKYAQLITSGYFDQITYGGGMFVASQNNRSADTYYSTNKIDWYRASLPQYHRVHELSYANGEFIAIEDQGYIYKMSKPWNRWDLVSKPYMSSAIYWVNNVYIGLIRSRTSDQTTIHYSYNLSEWYDTLIQLDHIQSVSNIKGKAIVCAYNESSILYSDDGIHWETISLPYSSSCEVATAQDKLLLLRSYDAETYTVFCCSVGMLIRSSVNAAPLLAEELLPYMELDQIELNDSLDEVFSSTSGGDSV